MTEFESVSSRGRGLNNERQSHLNCCMLHYKHCIFYFFFDSPGQRNYGLNSDLGYAVLTPEAPSTVIPQHHSGFSPVRLTAASGLFTLTIYIGLC